MGMLILVASWFVIASVSVRTGVEDAKQNESSQTAGNVSIAELLTKFSPGGLTVPGALPAHYGAQMPGLHAASPSIHNAPSLNLNHGAGQRTRLGAARSPAMMFQDPEYLPELELEQTFSEKVPKVNLGVKDIIRDWTVAAQRNGDDASSKVMSNTQEILHQMKGEIDQAVPEHVFAFTPGEASQESIQSLATVSSQVLWDDYDAGEDWNLVQLAQAQGLVSGSDAIHAGRIKVMNINEIVATPKARVRGVGAELIRRIVAWAKDRGCLVTLFPANDELQDYYEELGFELIDPFGRQMVYSGFGLEDERANGIMLDLH